MSILQDKKIAITLALIVIIVGSILYFTMDAQKSEDTKANIMDNAAPEAGYENNSSSNLTIPMIDNEAII